jgi:hypothetical protein
MLMFTHGAGRLHAAGSRAAMAILAAILFCGVPSRLAANVLFFGLIRAICGSLVCPEAKGSSGRVLVADQISRS